MYYSPTLDNASHMHVGSGASPSTGASFEIGMAGVK